MIVVHDINKKQGKKFWSHLDVFSLCYVLLKKVAPIAPRAPRAPISREYVRIVNKMLEFMPYYRLKKKNIQVNDKARPGTSPVKYFSMVHSLVNWFDGIYTYGFDFGT